MESKASISTLGVEFLHLYKLLHLSLLVTALAAV